MVGENSTGTAGEAGWVKDETVSASFDRFCTRQVMVVPTGMLSAEEFVKRM